MRKTQRSSARAMRCSVRAPEQLEFSIGASVPRWRYSRLVVRSRHFARICSRLETVRRHFPELDSVTIRVGLAQKRGVLGWGSLDPEEPAIWIRPRKLDLFTIAHELTHLLQARGFIPRGERACDLYALARSPQLVDTAPGYLSLPSRFPSEGRLSAGAGRALHRAARAAIDARASGRRNYLRLFERTLAEGSVE